MKTLSNTIGYLTALSLAIYAVFKFCYIEGAWLLMIISGILLSIYFLVMIPDKLRETSGGKMLPVHIVAAVCASILTLAVLASFQHWKISGILFLIGLAGFILLFVPMMLFQKLKKQGEKKLITLICAVGLELFSLGILCKLQHWWVPDILFVTGMATIFLVCIPWYWFIASHSPQKDLIYLQNVFLFTIIGLLFFLFVFGTLMNWGVTMEYRI